MIPTLNTTIQTCDQTYGHLVVYNNTYGHVVMYNNTYTLYDNLIFTISFWVFELLSKLQQFFTELDWFTQFEHFTISSQKYLTNDNLHFLYTLYTIVSITYILYAIRNIRCFTTNNNVKNFDIKTFITIDNKRLEHIEKLQSKINTLEKKVVKLKKFIDDLENGNIRRSDRIRNKALKTN